LAKLQSFFVSNKPDTAGFSIPLLHTGRAVLLGVCGQVPTASPVTLHSGAWQCDDTQPAMQGDKVSTKL